MGGDPDMPILGMLCWSATRDFYIEYQRQPSGKVRGLRPSIVKRFLRT